MKRASRFLLCGMFSLLLPLAGCDQPCETTSECGGGKVCAQAICQALTCETAMFARDPKSGACVALSGCFLTEEQRSWKTCAEDPCAGLSEGSCVTDSRCQPAYADPTVIVREGKNSDEPVTRCAGSGGFPGIPPDGDPQGAIAPGVNNGASPKHRATIGTAGCFAGQNQARVFAGCRAVPKLPERTACQRLDKKTCATRPDCTDGSDLGNDRGGVTIPVEFPSKEGTSAPVCFDRLSISESCEGANSLSCLLNPKCQPIGAKCFCPANTSCSCAGGAFLGCEDNDRLRRCKTAADCGAGERCDNDEACIAPRTFDRPLSTAEPVPGTGSCLGACVPMGCAGYGENRCHERPDCDAGSYGTVCRPKPYCTTERPSDPPAPDPTEPPIGNQPGLGQTCGCETEFTGCAPVAPILGLRPERSLLIRDPEIVTDPAFRLDTVFGKLAPAGQGDAFVATLMGRMGQSAVLSNGAIAPARKGAISWNDLARQRGQLSLAAFSQLVHTTALVNRIDLASPGNCGEARITFAMNAAYVNGNERFTAIVELKVADDGNGCRTVAQRWGELSLIDDVNVRRSRLVEIFGELLAPSNLAQLRTNEFLNRTGVEAWELREWKLGVDGLPELTPVKQSVEPRYARDAAFLTWANQNLAALRAGTAVVPTKYLAAASTENGSRLSLVGSEKDQNLKEAEKALNALSCAGCHLTETKSPFTHVGERLGKLTGGTYKPSGRAVLDEFMKKELQSRAENLRRVLSSGMGMAVMDSGVAFRSAHGRVH